MPPLEAMVVPSPIVSKVGISQVCKDIPPRPVSPQLEQCEKLEKNILEGHFLGQENTLVGLPILGHSSLPLDRQESCIRPSTTMVPGLTRGLRPGRDSGNTP